MKKVLITGATAGIGLCVANLLYNAGFKIYATGRKVEKIVNLQKENFIIEKLDVTEEQSVKQVIESIIKRDGKIDVLINNAGYGLYGPFEKIPIDEAIKQFKTNVFGLASVTKEVIPHMIKQKQGRIINVSSIAGSFGEPLGVWYHASKYAVDGISDSLRLELKKFNIDVVNIKPGPVKTEWKTIAVENLKSYYDDNYQDMISSHIKLWEFLWKNASTPEDIAKVIVKATVAKNPHPVYFAGRGTKFLYLLFKVLPVRIFDYIYLKTLFSLSNK